MLYKNTIKLLFLFIILLVSISAISAVDNSTDVTQEMGFNEVMGDRGSGSFTDLQTIIDNAPAGSTINLDKNYVYNHLIYPKHISTLMQCDQYLI